MCQPRLRILRSTRQGRLAFVKDSGTLIARAPLDLTEDLVVMKQPAENPNATREEVEAALARVEPIFHDSPVITEEVAKLAYQFWQERKGLAGSPENDWFRAEKIVRNRLKAGLTA